MQKRLVEDGRYRTQVTTWGSGDGPHAIVLPGMAATPHALAPQIRLLRRLGYTTHVIELPGFGVAPPLRQEDARFPELARLVIDAAHALGIDRAVVVGHSLGGGVALYVAMLERDLVERLVLLSPAAVGQSLLWTYKLYCVPLLGRALLRPYKPGTRRHARHFLVGSRRRGDSRFVDAILRQDACSPAQLRSMRAIVWANQPSFLKRLLVLVAPGGEQSAFTLRLRLSELRDIPTLVLWGNEDRVICAGDTAIFRAAHPGAEIHVVRGVGHSLPLEAPAWVNAHITRFVRGAPPLSRAA